MLFVACAFVMVITFFAAAAVGIVLLHGVDGKEKPEGHIRLTANRILITWFAMMSATAAAKFFSEAFM